jgi:dephospho-CoA kinase
MLKIGLTGGIGSGKTMVSKIFAEKGYKIFNSDEIAKMIIKNDYSVKNSIINFFGTNSYIGDDLNSRYISEIIYSDKVKLNYLNSLVHPMVFHQFEKFLKSNLNSKILVESAILFESNFYKMLDDNILLISPKADRISRIIKRDNINRSEIEKIMSVQWSDKKKISLATYVIENINFAETSMQILSLISKIELLSEKK